MRYRAPRVKRGQALTADLWNSLADYVDPPLLSPRQVEAPVTSEQVAETDPDPASTFYEVARASDTVRVENPDDENQYVNVERLRAITFSAGGQNVSFIYKA